MEILNKHIEKRVICPDCRGHKTKEIKEFKGHTEGYVSRTEICTTCLGQGLMKQTVKIEYEQIIDIA